MKHKRIVLLVSFVVLSLSILLDIHLVCGQESPSQPAQQKITTPPMQLSTEEEKSTSEKPSPANPQMQAPGTTPAGKQGPTAVQGQQQGGQAASQAISYAPTQVKKDTHVEIIIDASGSMNGLMEQSTKLAVLKAALVSSLSQPLPEGVTHNIGIRVYGSLKPSQENACDDTQLLREIKELDVSEVKQTIESITANGVTPIGFALEEAIKDFKGGENVDNVIILVADGEDSCNKDVCETAKRVYTDAKKIMINIIGFDLDQKSTKSLECITQNASGRFLQTRSESELKNAFDQILMANVPYNLKVQAMSGATAIPATMTVYKAGTKDIVREDKTNGVKYYQLPVGTYDIEIASDESKESPSPTKILKSVEVQATSKAEQTVQFDFGLITLSAFDQNNSPIGATYMLNKKEDRNVGAKFETPPGPYTTMLSKGTYSVIATATTEDGLTLSGKADALKVAPGETATQEFHFQVGKIKISGKDSGGNPISVAYKITVTGFEDKAVSEGIAPTEGKTIEVPPGIYDIFFHAALENVELKDLPSLKTEKVEVGGGETTEKIAEIPTATLTLSAKDAAGKFTETNFLIKPAGSDQTPAKIAFKDQPLSLKLPPGGYDVVAEYVTTETQPPPTISWENLQLVQNQTLTKEAIFKFGIINLFGKNAKGIPLNTAFYIYQVGGTNPVATLTNIVYKTEVKLPEGFYDIKAEDLTAINIPKPSEWIHNVEVKADKPASGEAVFTNGRVKLMCRGPNDVVLTCTYRLFAYGKDSPLFEGETTDAWKMFDIPTGQYYIEAGYHDVKDEVLLKKWITIKVGENEMLEQIIRF